MSKLCRLPGVWSNGYNKVACIKALRQITGMDLKESKDAVELAAEGGVFVLRGKTIPRHCDAEIDVLKGNGLMITGNEGKVEFILHSMKANAKMAIDCDENNLAILIIDALDKFEDKQNK